MRIGISSNAVASFIVFFFITLFFYPNQESSINVSKSRASEASVDKVHTWKSKLIKSDKTLLEVVKEEAPNIEVMPLQIFFYRELFEVTFERYLPFYRLKEGAVLATYDEAAECLKQLDSLPSKEKACALFALTIFENKRRPRPQSLQDDLIQKAGPKEVPYFPYRNQLYENPLELWTGDYEPDASIPSTFWAECDKANQEAQEDVRPAFKGVESSEAISTRRFGASGAANLTEARSKSIKKCFAKVEDYVGKFDSAELFNKFNARHLTYYGSEGVDTNPVFVQVLQAFEEFTSDDVSEIQTVYALREFLLLQTYQIGDGLQTSEIIGGSQRPASYHGDLLGMNSAYHEKTVSRIARELQTVRLCYDGSSQLPDRDAIRRLETEYSSPSLYVSAWEVEYKSRNKKLLDVVKEESKNIEVLPRPLYGGAFDRALTFERFLPVYRLEEAAKFAECGEALECVERFDTLSSKEKACALYSLSIVELRNKPRNSFAAPAGVQYADSLKRHDDVVVSPIYYALWSGQFAHADAFASYCRPTWDADNYWAKFDAVFAKALDDNETAFPALVSEGATSEATRTNEDAELASAWANNIATCVKQAQNYVGGDVSEADFLAAFDPITLYILLLRARNHAPKETDYDPNSFTARFIKGVENVRADFYKGLKNLNSDDYAEMQKAYALFEYWARLHTKTSVLFPPFEAGSEESNEPTSFVDSSRRVKTVGDVANEIQKLRLERKSLNMTKDRFRGLIM